MTLVYYLQLHCKREEKGRGNKGSRIFQSVSGFLSEIVAYQRARKSINNLVFFNGQCDHFTDIYRGQLQAMTRGQFDKTSKTNSAI